VSGLLELIRIEATFEVASILCSRKPGLAARGSARVLRHERVESVRLILRGGMVVGASEEHHVPSVGRWQGVVRLS
jgi:hypothetical protein